MKLEEIFSEWEKDSDINRADLTGESIKISQLHFKYFKVLSHERLLLKKMETDKSVLYRDLFDYYVGAITDEKLKERGWSPNYKGRTLKSDFPMIVESDESWIECKLKVSLQQEKVDVLESIIKTIANRSFQISNIVAWEKFKVGELK